MDRKELINMGADAVRNTPHLFNAYKQFLIEDWGSIPPGCFGCQFKSHFTKWKSQILTDNIQKMENQTNNKTYVLKDKSTNKYLFGEVYSNYSTDEHWLKYLELKPEGKSLFTVLPASVERTQEQQQTEDDFKKKELIESPTAEDVVVDEVHEDLEHVEETEEVDSPTTEDVLAEKPKRGRKKED